MSKFFYLTFVALVAGLFGFAAEPARAFPVMSPPALNAPVDTGPIISAKSGFRGGFQGHRSRGPRYYNYNRYPYYNRYQYRRYYGNRCFGWNSYYCGGRYYGGPFIGLGFGTGYYYYNQPRYSYRYGNRHVAWCKNRYKSYKPSNNTWVAKSGKVRQCKSPYWP
jgi:hypothetical protein